MENITFITGNPGKAEQVAFYLHHPVNHHKLDLTEVQSLDLEEVVRAKAAEAYSILGSPVLVEDVSLTFPALGRLPGPLIKWFLQELENEGLCRLLDGKDRAVVAEVLFGYHDGTTCHLFSGIINGTVADHPRGTMGFGWSPIFVADDHDKTLAEMPLDEQKDINMRSIALKKLQEFLEKKS